MTFLMLSHGSCIYIIKVLHLKQELHVPDFFFQLKTLQTSLPSWSLVQMLMISNVLH